MHNLERKTIEELRELVISHADVFDIPDLSNIHKLENRNHFTPEITKLACAKLSIEGEKPIVWVNSSESDDIGYLFGDNGGVLTVLSLDGDLDVFYDNKEQGKTQVNNIFNSLYDDVLMQDEDFRRNREEKKIHDSYRNRLSNMPEVPDDFYDALQFIADYVTCYDEFQKILSPNMMDGSERNRTRIGRAAIALNPEHFDNMSRLGDVTIYRALPFGSDIEAGDWVTPYKSYAETHLSKTVKEGEILEMTVPGDEVWSYASDPNEMIYIPKNTWAFSNTYDLWQSLTDGLKPDSHKNKIVDKELPLDVPDKVIRRKI